jgi:hypothetical protein
MANIMNHPTQNEWLKYVDGEASPEDLERLEAHLKQCPMCATEVAGWRRSVQKLRRWPIPAARQMRGVPRSQAPRFAAFVKWGLAAVIVLGVGFGFGRLSVLRAASFQQSVAVHVREDLKRELQADLLAALDADGEAKDDFEHQLRVVVQTAQAKSATQNARLCRELIQVEHQQRLQDRLRLQSLITAVHDQQVSDTLALRRDLETAVSTADSDLRQDSRRISELANTLLTAQH